MKRKNKYNRVGSTQDFSTNEHAKDYEDEFYRGQPGPAESMSDYGPNSSIRSMGNAYWQDPKPHFGPHYGKGPKGYQRSDERIKEDISEALRVHSEIDATEIEIEVSAGVVSLSGTVDSRKTKRMVEDEIELISGVNDVKNDLRILTSVEGPQPGWGKEMPSRNVTKTKTQNLRSSSLRS